MNILLITSNSDKIADAKRVLGQKIDHIKLDLDELQELNVEKIAEHKVKQAFNQVQKPLVTWDQSVFIHCLNEFPGPLIKWFWQQVTLEKICEIAQLYNDRGIKAQTLLTFFDGKKLKHFYGTVHGNIPEKPRGNGGFGWDPIFIPDGSNLTYSEMNPKDSLFHAFNTKPFIQLKKFLKTFDS